MTSPGEGRSERTHGPDNLDPTPGAVGFATAGAALRQFTQRDDPAIVTAEFRVGRPEPDLLDLFADTPTSGPIFELRPSGPCEGLDIHPSRPAYLRVFRDALAVLGDRPLVLMGYYSGGMVAFELAVEQSRSDLFARQDAWLLFVVAAVAVLTVLPPVETHSLHSPDLRGTQSWSIEADRVADFEIPLAQLLHSPERRGAVDAVYGGLFS
jgi:hypothetical protein